jgi:hypothetical protein
VDSIEYRQEPDTITLHCLDDAIELEKQYDDTYGRVEGTYTCAYGNTDDLDGQIAALLPADMTRTVPTTGIHDKLIYAAGTRRIDAINQTIDQTPILGWYMLPMKHIVFTAADNLSTPDTYTESDGDWTFGANSAKGTYASGGKGVMGSVAIYLGRSAVAGAGAFSGYYKAISVGPTNLCNLALYYNRDDAGTTGLWVRIHTVAGSDYWQYTLPTPNSSTPGTFASYLHLNLHLPDGNGTHGWTATGSPSVSSNIVRIELGGTANAGKGTYFDVLFLYTRKKGTNKYTVSNILNISKMPYVGYNKVSVVSSATGSPHTVEDATRETLHGVREFTIVDKQITEDSHATYTASAIIASESEAEENEQITIAVLNPGDMYNVMPGDTVTVTYANLNLNSATRTLVGRADSITEQGWRTTLITGIFMDPLKRTYNILKTKHF